ncbi:hypothetical protein J2755_001890 [Methanohalophilus levihalophilus]|nr:hypothetical protein [Methanohalophilus levihalophilus]
MPAALLLMLILLTGLSAAPGTAGNYLTVKEGSSTYLGLIQGKYYVATVSDINWDNNVPKAHVEMFSFTTHGDNQVVYESEFDRILAKSDTITLRRTGYDPIEIKIISISEEYVKLDFGEYNLILVEPFDGWSVEEYPLSSNSLKSSSFVLPLAILALLGILSFLYFYQKRKQDQNPNSDGGIHGFFPDGSSPTLPTTASESHKGGIITKSAFSYKGATIVYKVRVENPTTEPIGDLQVSLFVPNVFLIEDKQKSISMLEPGESKTVTFEIRPTGECGDCNVSGKLNYYDYLAKERCEINIEKKSICIICPMLHPEPISENEWRSTLLNFTKTEEGTREIDMAAFALFEVTSDIFQDMNLYMLEPKITESPNLYRAVTRFYGEGVKNLKYAAQIEVVGGEQKSRLILKAWAEKEEALTGFYHGMLDEIEKRIHVKELIDSTIVYNFHYGDNVETTITDSLVQRSNIGLSKHGASPSSD